MGLEEGTSSGEGTWCGKGIKCFNNEPVDNGFGMNDSGDGSSESMYRVSNMELVRVLPSVEDEVNVACFHPSVGGDLIYGTKEGNLRILQYDSSNGMTHNTPDFLDENMLEDD
ncbi:hypothetical protein V6N11_064371 [Hibiscus sabdariffa]|uniref:Uncharacterized protein n=1 Tax=Hibiscus sabdariffa TaxID=183260 RepID=A0ABR2PNT3_9ROSI